MKKVFGLSLVVMTLALQFVATTAQAADGSSGCGAGWYLFKDNSLVSSSLRTTTNGFLFPAVTLGMTFGTSNCTKHSIVMHEQESLHFATQNMAELRGESTRGSGKYLQAFSETIGCDKEASSAFSKMMKQNQSAIFKEQNPEAVLKQVYIQIFSDAHLTNKCSLHLS